jgi:tetratricopeptide (TPR) repeat protein
VSSSPLDPTKITEASDRDGPYRKSILAVDNLLEQGMSLSGHERNVCFLNLARGDARFATASAVSGIDFDDDARAVAPVDWDGDGDLDLWLANRTAPMLRFLKNTHHDSRPDSTPADWVQVQLEATRGARDAIGGRVTLELADGGRVTRVLKAGEGFLTQTSKRLHFGLGPDARIIRTRVRWPGRDEELFAGVGAGTRWLLKEGAGKAGKSALPRKPPILAAGAATPPASDALRAVAGSRLPLPRLPWETFEGQPRHTGGPAEGFTLLNLWASWCAPCVKELKELAHAHTNLAQAGVSVLALSVDGLAGDGEPGNPAALARQWNLPFPTGRATASLVRRVEYARTHAWGVKWPLPVPTSLLIDRSGRLAVLYLGPVTATQILADASLAASANDEAWHDAATPFPGPWIERPNRPIALPLALDLMAEGALEDTREFADRNHPTLSKHPEFVLLLAWIGDGLLHKGDTETALGLYRQAVAENGNNVLLLNNLAWQLAAHPDPAFRRGAEAVRLAEKASSLSNHQDPTLLDTLAAAYAEAGRFPDAVATSEKALDLARQTNAAPSVAESITKGLTFYRQGRAYGR